LCWVMSRSSIISTSTSTMHHSCCSCLWGFDFHPQSLLGAWHHLQVICSSVTWLRLLFQLSWLVALYSPTSLYFYSAYIASPAA
jgi:hypothetical protein